MTDAQRMRRPIRRWLVGITVLLVIALLLTSPGQRAAIAFIGALRIRKPDTVSVSVSVPAGAERPIQRIFTALLADSATNLVDEPDQSVAGVAQAAHLVGFVPLQVGARRDTATVSVIGGYQLAFAVNRPLLLTMLSEAGERGVTVAPAVNGAPVVMRTSNGVRLQYGHCPQPGSDTSRVPIREATTATYGDCVMLTEIPFAEATLPAGIDPDQLMRLALEVFGLTPDQTVMLQRRFPWPAILTLSLPRFMRSYDTVTVQGRPAALFTSGGRRGSSYDLCWARDSVVISLVGYSSPTAAVPLAESVR